jgi:signal transduction histidine kinase/ligand-binding sensor domain-containing protein
MRRPSTAAAATLTCALVASAALVRGASAATTGVLTGYALTTWSESDEGPFGAIAAIAQDADGYLWIGTSAGLFRFDGVRFTPWHRIGTTRLPAAAVTALLVGRDGRLWVGLDNGAGVAAIDKRQVKLFDSREVDSVTALAEGSDGTIWAVDDPGLYRLDGRTWTRVPLSNGAAQARVVNVGTFANGAVWAGATSGLFVRTATSDEFTRQAADWAWAATEDGARNVWITDTVTGIRRSAEPMRPRAGFEGNGYRLIYDRRGHLWVATIGEGLWRVRAEPDGELQMQRATLQSGLFSDSVQSLLEDREGNVWVGTTVGLHRLTLQKMTPVTNIGLVNSAEARDGRFWVGTSYGVVALEADSWQRDTSATIAAPYVRNMRWDTTGVLWASTSEGLMRAQGDRLQPFTIPAEYGMGGISCMVPRRRGGMWVGDGRRLVFWDKGRWAPLTPPSEAPEAPIACIHDDSAGRQWLGYPGARLGLVEKNAFRLFPPETFGPDANTIIRVTENADGTVWVTTNAGISRFAGGRFTTVTRANGLPAGRPAAIVEDDDGDLWVHMDVGILRIPPGEIDRVAADQAHRVRYQFYDSSDGLAGAPILSVRAGRAVDGKLWFVRGGALTIADPRTIRRWPEVTPGPVRIETASADERRFEAVEALDVPAGTKRVGIDYTAVALTQPNRVRFRYRLDGFDTEWVLAGTRRSAVYTNLPPRDYRFRVEASTEEDGWTEASAATMSFTVLPAFYQTGWFYGLCVLVAGAVIAGAWRLRESMVKREYSAVLAERARLSREIHDTLLQSLVGVALQMDHLAHGVCAASAEAKETLLRTGRRVEAYVREARQSILDLRSPVLDTVGLPEALRQIGKDVTEEANLGFALTVTGRPRRCSARLENELLRIGHEAIINAVRHAQASQIRLELRFEADAVSLKVLDDGRGFTPSPVGHEDDPHYGLVSMRERAENLGGRFTIARSPSGGTEVEAIVPTSAAA